MAPSKHLRSSRRYRRRRQSPLMLKRQQQGHRWAWKRHLNQQGGSESPKNGRGMRVKQQRNEPSGSERKRRRRRREKESKKRVGRTRVSRKGGNASSCTVIRGRRCVAFSFSDTSTAGYSSLSQGGKVEMSCTGGGWANLTCSQGQKQGYNSSNSSSK